MEGIILGYLFIFFARVLDVSMATIRMLMIVQGRRIQAALIGFFEVSIYVLALGKVVSGLNNPINLLVYALGFASGNYIGIFIEEKMALGNLTAQVVISYNTEEVVDLLRAKGFGVTVIEGYGKEGLRNILNITLARKDLDKLHETLESLECGAFITVSSTKQIRGGYMARIKKK